MLKITKEEKPDAVVLRLDGAVTGPWVNEFQEAWRVLALDLGTRRLLVDLRGVTFMNAKARALLADIYGATRAQFLADTPLTKQFAEEAMSGDSNREGR